MTDEQKKVLSLGKRSTLELKKPAPSGSAGAGSVKQSFSHGRSKTVAVEVKRVREGSIAPKPANTGTADMPSNRSASASLRELTNEERTARARALRGAVLGEGVKPRDQNDNSFRPGLVENKIEPKTETDFRAREIEEMRQIQEAEKSANNSQADGAERKTSTRPMPTNNRAGMGTGTGLRKGTGDRDDERGGTRRGVGLKRGDDEGGKGPRFGRLTVTQALEGDDEGGRRRGRSLASIRRRMEKGRRAAMEQQEPQKITRDVIIPEVITVQELANRMATRSADVIKSLMKLGVMATINEAVDADTAELIATEFGHRVKRVTESDIENLFIDSKEDAPESLMPRPPVVTVMGHVDHGKTSLLDALRKTNVVKGEAGGITQHIGAYQVVLPEPLHGFDKITFIDTPGHAAFTEMRSRGAQVTDIVILVVAADDGIMPQTLEAIRHAKAANVPMIVAINKCDLPAAKPDRVRQELLQHDIQVEEMGGDTLSVELSAKTGVGLDKLIDAVLLQAEILNLKANPHRDGEGTVIEAKLEKGRGPVATILIRRGTIKIGDIFVAGSEWGRIRALINSLGKNVSNATPSMPVEILGLGGTPLAGDSFAVVEDEGRAREITALRHRQKQHRQVAAVALERGTLSQMMDSIKAGVAKELPILIKGDVHGSVEAIKNALLKQTEDNTEVRARILEAAVGAITESDVTLASASKAILIGFNVRANGQARDLAKRLGVDIRYYSIIYNVIDDIKQALSGMLAPTLREKFLGNAQILQVFNITKVGKVAGCKVVEGTVKRGGKVRLLRDNVVIHEGTLKTLKRIKDEVREVASGYECGMAFENYDNIKEGDVIECFEIESIARTL